MRMSQILDAITPVKALVLQGIVAPVKQVVVMFENIEIIENKDGTATIIFDLNNDQLEIIKNILKVSSDKKIDFEKAFEIFVNEAVQFYIEGNK
jgi:hypothetical protein